MDQSRPEPDSSHDAVAPEPAEAPMPDPDVSAAVTVESTPAVEQEPALDGGAAEPDAELPDQPAAQIPTSGWAAADPDPVRWAPNPLLLQEPKPKPPPPTCDPLAVAVANASLLGAGYLMLRSRLFAALSVLVTFALVITLVNLRSSWVEVALVLWWAAMITHGWFLARPGKPIRKQRLIAAALTIPVVLSVGVLRFDAARVENRIDEAKGAGECGAAVTAVDGLWAVHTIANAPMTARSDVTKQTCLQLEQAVARLAAALREGDTEELKRGFDALTVPLGHEKLADRTREGFIGLLPSDDPCHTSTVTDWLKDNTDRQDVVERVAPAALVECGDVWTRRVNHHAALQQYRQFLEEYPGHELTPKAQEGEKRAMLAIELANVRALLQTGRYCDSPTPYSGAPAYGKGVNKSMVLGNDEYAARLGDWLAKDASEATLIVCTGKTEMGAPTQTCPYEPRLRPGTTYVTFKKIAIPVRAFELKTGKLVADTRVEIGGASCPPILQYTSYGRFDSGPPSEVHVNASDADVRNGFAPIITP